VASLGGVPFAPAVQGAGRGGLVGNDFGIDTGFADPAGNELGDLRSEVDDENLVGHAM